MSLKPTQPGPPMRNRPLGLRCETSQNKMPCNPGSLFHTWDNGPHLSTWQRVCLCVVWVPMGKEKEALEEE